MKVILAHGIGRSHFFEAAKPIKENGVGIKIISGWRPSKISPFIVNFLGKLVGRNDLFKRLGIRDFNNLAEDDIIENSLPEFFFHFLLIFSKFKIISTTKVDVLGWKYLGHTTKKYLKDANIFHVRSGAGQGGAIRKAKEIGMITVADHSIAHPKEIEDNLIYDFNKYNFNQLISPNNDFWKLVLQDCIDADYILVNSDYVKKTFIRNGFPDNKIKVIYLGVRDDFFGLKKSYLIKSSIRLLFTGGFNLRKGARILVETVNILSKSNIDFELHVVGAVDKEGTTVLKDLIHSNKIILHGYVLQNDLKTFLINSDMYVFPTFAEGSAKSAMEAMATGLPVITTENCGLPITSNLNGIIIPHDNAHALADAIIRLSKNEELREYLGVNAAQLIKENYTWDIYGKNIKNFYESIYFNV